MGLRLKSKLEITYYILKKNLSDVYLILGVLPDTFKIPLNGYDYLSGLDVDSALEFIPYRDTVLE
ncbi:MAG: hypothetical protein DRP65_04710 [Planctomycetota bacterium]|nr:MAG: hypothetical protein DRP65_04710 [Planctomycetota bacterium]